MPYIKWILSAGSESEQVLFLARYKLIFRLYFYTLHHFIGRTSAGSGLCSNLSKFSSCWQNPGQSGNGTCERRKSFMFLLQWSVTQTFKVRVKSIGEKKTKQTSKQKPPTRPQKNPKGLTEFLSIFTDYDRKYLQIFPLSRFFSCFISPDQKDQVAESNLFLMKQFVTGHISAAPDTGLMLTSKEVLTVNLWQYTWSSWMLFWDWNANGTQSIDQTIEQLYWNGPFAIRGIPHKSVLSYRPCETNTVLIVPAATTM